MSSDNTVSTNQSSSTAGVTSAVIRSAAAQNDRGVKISKLDEAKRNELRAAHDKQASYCRNFDPDRVGLFAAENVTKVVMLNEQDEPDEKSSAVLEIPPLVAVTSNVAGEGNCGQGDFAPARNLSAFSFGLACGNSKRNEALPEEWEKDQVLTKEVVKVTSKRLLGLWFDSSGKEHCQSGYDTAIKAARATISGRDPAKYPKAENVMQAEKKDAELREEVRQLARQNFIDGGKIPFGTDADENGNVTQEIAFVSSKAWNVIPKRWKQSMSKEGPKGPTIQDVPTASENMQYLRKEMAKHNYQYHPILYKKKKKGGVVVDLPRPIVKVPKTDAMNNVVLDPVSQRPIMVDEIDIMFDPMNWKVVDGIPKKAKSMVQCKVVFALTNGGNSGKYGVKLNLFGEVTICKTDESDGADHRDYGDFGCDDDDDTIQPPADLPKTEAEGAQSGGNAGANLTGLAGAGAGGAGGKGTKRGHDGGSSDSDQRAKKTK